MFYRTPTLFFTLAFLLFEISIMLSPAQGQTTYQTPPQEVIDIVDAMPEPSVSLSPDAKWMLFVDRNSMPDIADLARRMVGVAGMRIDPIANGGFQTDYFRGLTVRKRESNAQTRIPVAEPARITTISWSHDSQSFVFAGPELRTNYANYGLSILMVPWSMGAVERLVLFLIKLLPAKFATA